VTARICGCVLLLALAGCGTVIDETRISAACNANSTATIELGILTIQQMRNDGISKAQALAAAILGCNPNGFDELGVSCSNCMGVIIDEVYGP
jgi:hypothetical protein